MSSTNETYWAAAPVSDLTMACGKKIQSYYKFCTKFGFTDLWRRSYISYYGQSENGASSSSRLGQVGTNGEYYTNRVNHFRSLLQNLLTLTTAQRPALQPKAQNTDSKSLNQTVLARSILDYYLTEKRLEKDLKKATEFGLIAGEGFLTEAWNATKGQIYTVTPTGAPIYDGELEFRVFHPIDVIRECWSENTQSPDWYIIREFRNKWDLAAKYPEMAKEIISIGRTIDPTTRYTFLSGGDDDSNDYIPVYKFYHVTSEALPNGRQMEFISDDVYLSDGPLAYKSMPIYRIAPADYHGTPMGYTVAYDLLGLQKTYDSLMSIITTNQLNYGVQNILIPRGAEINVVSLGQGLNAIEYDRNVGEPKPLNLVQTPSEIFSQLDRIQHLMETLSGINSVARGNPESSLHSGAALALVAAQAIQFNSGLAASYTRLLEDSGTGIIEILQEYAATPRLAQIAGKSNRARLKEFKGEDLLGINRVTAESVNPLSRTAAGRLQAAQDLLQNKLITNPAHYFEVLTTGTIDTMYESEVAAILNIRSENEDLADGTNPPVMMTDMHVEHIKEHEAVLSGADARHDPRIVAAVTAHMQDHIAALRNGDPALLKILGQEPLPPATPPGGGPQGGAPQGGPPPQDAGPQSGAAPGQTGAPTPSNMAAIQNPTPPAQQEAAAIKPAGMPRIPQGTPDATKEAIHQMMANAGGPPVK